MTISSGYKYICIAINLLPGWCLTRLNRSPARGRRSKPYPMLPSSGTAGGAGQPPRIPSSRWMDDRRKGFPSSAPPFSCGTERPAAPSAWRQRCPSSLRSAGLPELDPAPAARGVTQQQTHHGQLKTDKPQLKEKKEQERLLVPSVCLGPKPTSIVWVTQNTYKLRFILLPSEKPPVTL